MRISRSAISAITPTSTAASVISRTSRLRMCEISCAITPSSSRWSISATRPGRGGDVGVRRACGRRRRRWARRPRSGRPAACGRARRRSTTFSTARTSSGCSRLRDGLRVRDARHEPAGAEVREQAVADADEPDDDADRRVERVPDDAAATDARPAARTRADERACERGSSGSAPAGSRQADGHGRAIRIVLDAEELALAEAAEARR